MIRYAAMSPEPVAWVDVARRIADGDPAAYAQLARLITGILRGCRAYDFSADWEDLAQEVIAITVERVGDGRIAADGAVTR